MTTAPIRSLPAVNLLARKLNGKAVPAPITLVPGTIVYRESTRVK